MGRGQVEQVLVSDPHQIRPDERRVLHQDGRVAVGGDPPDGEQVRVGEVQVAVCVDGGAAVAGLVVEPHAVRADLDLVRPMARVLPSPE